MNSWIEIDKHAANQMIRAIDGKNYKGRRIRMNEANSLMWKCGKCENLDIENLKI